MKTILVFLQTVVVVFGVISAPSLLLAQTDKRSWQSEWEETLAAAKREGTVVVSIPTSAELRKQMQAAFHKRFDGIQLELVAARGSASVHRILEEKKAGVHYFDLHIGGTNSIITGLLSENILEPVLPWLILPEVKDAKNWWGEHIFADNAKQYIYMFLAYLTQTLWYNATLVKPEEFTSYDDLLEPKWKGKIAILDPRNAGSGQSTWGFLWRIKGEEYLKKLAAQEMIIGRNQRQLAEAVVKGKASISIGLSYYTYLPFIKAGLPIKVLPAPKEGIYASSGSGNLVILKNAPHPNATKVFVNWLLSKEGQSVVSKALGQPTRRFDVETEWTHNFGVTAAKEVLTPAKFYELENQSEEVVWKVREPAAALASKLLK